MAAQHNGVKPIWSSEIEKFPQAVTKHHFPDVIQLGDITMLDGATLPPVDIICAGSPCQDLSVAGKREGLKGERSGLFINAINIVRRMRWATNGRYPRFFVWENVPGAFSSGRDEFGNKCRGADFRAVLEEIGQAEVPMPADGRWAENGVAQLPGCEIAWRTLDAVAWVPQRRKRIFLIADFGPGRPCAKEILFVEKSMRGNFEKGQCQGEEVAGCVADGSGAPICLRMRGGREGGGKGALLSENRSLTLAANTNDQVVFSFDSLSSNSMKSANPNSGCRQVEVAKTLDTSTQDPSKNQGGVAVVYPLEGNGVRESHRGPGYSESDKMFTLNTVERHAVAYCIAGNMVDRETHQHGLGVSENVSSTLTSVDRHAVAQASTSTMVGAECWATSKASYMTNFTENKAQTLVATDWKDAPVLVTGNKHTEFTDEIYTVASDERSSAFKKNVCDTLTHHDHFRSPVVNVPLKQEKAVDVRNLREQSINGTLQAKPNGGQSLNLNNVVRQQYAVRRLTPTECERLQGLPDGYTLIDDKSCSDSARYKALGNGMAQPCADFVIRRIVEEVFVDGVSRTGL